MQPSVVVYAPQFTTEGIVMRLDSNAADEGEVYAWELMQGAIQALCRRTFSLDIGAAQALANRAVLFDLRDDETDEPLHPDAPVSLAYNISTGYFAELELRLAEDREEVAKDLFERIALADRDQWAETEEQSLWPAPLHVDAVNWAPLMTISTDDDVDEYPGGAGRRPDRSLWTTWHGRWDGKSANLMLADNTTASASGRQLQSRLFSSSGNSSGKESTPLGRKDSTTFQPLHIEEEVDEEVVVHEDHLGETDATPPSKLARQASSFFAEEKLRSFRKARGEAPGRPSALASSPLPGISSVRSRSRGSSSSISRESVSRESVARHSSVNQFTRHVYARRQQDARGDEEELGDRIEAVSERNVPPVAGTPSDIPRRFTASSTPTHNKHLLFHRQSFSVPISPHPSSIHLKTQRPGPSRDTLVRSASPLPVSPSRGLMQQFRGVPDMFGDAASPCAPVHFTACDSFTPEWNHRQICCRCGETDSRHRVRQMNEQLRAIAKLVPSP